MIDFYDIYGLPRKATPIEIDFAIRMSPEHETDGIANAARLTLLEPRHRLEYDLWLSYQDSLGESGIDRLLESSEFTPVITEMQSDLELIKGRNSTLLFPWEGRLPAEIRGGVDAAARQLLLFRAGKSYVTSFSMSCGSFMARLRDKTPAELIDPERTVDEIVGNPRDGIADAILPPGKLRDATKRRLVKAVLFSAITQAPDDLLQGLGSAEETKIYAAKQIDPLVRKVNKEVSALLGDGQSAAD